MRFAMQQDQAQKTQQELGRFSRIATTLYLEDQSARMRPCYEDS